MDASKFFTSTYLNAKHLNGDVELRIESCDVEKIGPMQDEKLVVRFQNFAKGLVLNKTNFESLEEGFGPETSDWLGRRVTLYVAETKYKDEKKDGIRIKVAPGDFLPRSKWSTPTPAPESEMNDEIPF